ncbi:MAG: NAD-glutamate dehydrogenase domain-containing protein [Planctomycetota bacterium]|jgi:glutamate dehydrogenase
MRTEPTTVAPPAASVEPLVAELTDGLRQTAESVVPWFLAHMPSMYFQDTDHATQLGHLRAIIAARASGRPIELTLRSEDGGHWTFMRPKNYPGVLAELVSELPYDRPLRAAKIHTATDGELVVDTFEFGEAERFDVEDPEQRRKLDDTIAYAAEHQPDWTPEEITGYFRKCSAEYVLTLTPLRMVKHWELYQAVTGTDGTAAAIEPETDPTQCRIVVAVGNATTRTMLERIAERLSRSQINIHRAYLDVIDDGPHGSISFLGFVVEAPAGGPIDEASDLWQSARADLLRLKWFDQRVLDLSYDHEALDLTRAEIVVALGDLAHQSLVKVNPYAFNQDRILRCAERNVALVARIADLFLRRFDPDDPMGDEAFDAASRRLDDEIEAEVDLEDARTVLHRLVEAAGAVLRTNVFLESRYGLAMRLDPGLLASPERQQLPYGVFFVHGRQFNGFHVRFRDIARGGLRVVRPIGSDQHAREAERLYDEAYDLAFAQQLKNKDIPEGGAKAAVLVEADARRDRCVKGFVDAILDLITPDESTRGRIVDYFGHPELLYLGPDENITPELIDWIVARARRRAYPTPTALMSSKPGAGINHKRYGVTSEGVTVFLDVALRSIGIDPDRDPFTIKITGGPDGDVAGNEIRILHRDYGDRARIVGIADGSGTAEDPAGLDHEELLRLVAASLPVCDFDRARLSPEGRVVALDEPDGVHLRNTMHNRIIADAFVPAGGRPNAIHAGNWQEYLSDGGRPCSRVIVEGANLFLTPEARRNLSDCGVVILKDSSANKCGVICSSFEIVASMLLSESEFLAIKERFVQEVLGKLRELARREAELLLRVHRHRPQVPLPDMSIRLSEVMIRTADAIETAIESLQADEPALLRQLVVDHLPPVLMDTGGERLWKQTPEPYLRWIMAKSLAARMVYREGFDYLESMPLGAIARLAVQYLRLEVERRRLAEEVSRSDLPSRDRIASLLDQAGIFPTLGVLAEESPTDPGG